MILSGLMSPMLLCGQLQKSPFIHANVSKVFEQIEFSAILESFPEICEMVPVPQRNGSLLRHHLFLSSKSIATLAQKKRRFWNNLLAECREQAPYVKSYILSKCRSQYQLNEDDDLSLAIRLVNEQLPFNLPVHIDQAKKAGVFIVYLSNSDSSEQLGTNLYEPEAQNVDKFRVAVSIPFKPNSGLVLPRSPNSWHGGVWHGQGTRKTLHLYLFKHPSKKSRDILAAHSHFF